MTPADPRSAPIGDEPVAPPGHVLVVDDDINTCQMLVDGLKAEGFQADSCTSGDAALRALEANDYGVVITDLRMLGMSGIDVCKQIVATRSDVAVIVVTAFGSMETAIDALRAGAYDFITKPFDLQVVAIALARAFERRALRLEVERLRRATRVDGAYGDLLGASSAMLQVYDLLDRIAGTDSTLLLTGESGTGKEIAAREIHRRSKRRDGPFVAVNCAAMPEALLESELFGHVRGAFTDARAAHYGLLVTAQGGTLLLDEIGDLPAAIQPKLLRVLQERSVRPLGGTAERSIDVRIIACTHRDLESRAEEGLFRQDLFYRINVIHVAMPALRERGGDVLLLAQRFLETLGARVGKQVSGLSPAAAERLMAYDWPGNVRELHNCMERAVALARSATIEVADFPERIRNHDSRHVLVAGNDPSELVPLDEVEKRYILRALEATGGNKTLAAQRLGLSRKTLYRRLVTYGVAVGDEGVG
jgi:two-component system, NtrC family, response regulator AtoC